MNPNEDSYNLHFTKSLFNKVLLYVSKVSHSPLIPSHQALELVPFFGHLVPQMSQGHLKTVLIVPHEVLGLMSHHGPPKPKYEPSYCLITHDVTSGFLWQHYP